VDRIPSGVMAPVLARDDHPALASSASLGRTIFIRVDIEERWEGAGAVLQLVGIDIDQRATQSQLSEPFLLTSSATSRPAGDQEC
jgi:hypothetical protein